MAIFSPRILGGMFLLAVGGAQAGTTSFESSEGFELGADVSKKAGWTQSDMGTGQISNLLSHVGHRSLELAAKGKVISLSFEPGKEPVIFLDFYIRPVADSSPLPQYTVNANGAKLGFLTKDRTEKLGAVVAVVDPQKAALPAGHDFSIDGSGLVLDWIRITIRQDFIARVWDLFVDGELCLIDQPLLPAESGAAALSVYASAEGRSYLDDITIGAINPLFADADKDGIPDASEIVNGSNPYYSDRQFDANGDGRSNIANWQRGEPSGFSLKKVRRVIFVDNRSGNDALPGGLSYRAGSDGPKASLRSAIQAAAPDEVIAIMPSPQPYTLVEKAKGTSHTINLVPIGDISLKTADSL